MGEKINIIEKTKEYKKMTEKDEGLEKTVIKALNNGDFEVTNPEEFEVTNPEETDIYEAVWEFFTEMYNKRKKKFSFFNFLYKSSFKNAYKAADTKKKNAKDKVNTLLTNYDSNNNASILSSMNGKKVKEQLDSYARDEDDEEEYGMEGQNKEYTWDYEEPGITWS